MVLHCYEEMHVISAIFFVHVYTFVQLERGAVSVHKYTCRDLFPVFGFRCNQKRVLFIHPGQATTALLIKHQTVGTADTHRNDGSYGG